MSDHDKPSAASKTDDGDALFHRVYEQGVGATAVLALALAFRSRKPKDSPHD